jgi:hypothetical protein
VSHGGARPGAGRPRLTLAELVRSRSFDWQSRRHRRLLLEDEVPDWLQERLEALGHGRLLGAYRTWQEMGNRAMAPGLAQTFADLVRRGLLDE